MGWRGMGWERMEHDGRFSIITEFGDWIWLELGLISIEGKKVEAEKKTEAEISRWLEGC